MKRLFSLFFISLNLHAVLLISPYDAMKLHYGEEAVIEKHSILLNKKEAKEVTKLAQTKLKTKIYKIYRATKDDKLLGFGILVLSKVRSKYSAILSIIALDASLTTIETISFNEPPEYIPSKSWITVLENKKLSPSLKVGKDIPSITAATMSARAATKSARIALAIFEVKFKEK
ncbi:MAG: FMN-binding protein [Arcobacter sp.]|nr:MAG: FMN-binding protein [Arcobacter sp.]